MPNLNDIMEMMNALETKAVITLPTRCVAVRNRNSHCRRCADVCFADAISIEKNELTIDAGACVACGCCIAVCPTQALVSTDPMEEELAHVVAQTVPLTEGTAVIACARMAARQTGDPDKYAVVPCLGRMDEQLLVDLASRGVDTVLVDGTCATCKYRAAVPAIDDTVESARTLLETVGSTASITRTSQWPASVQVADLRKAVGAARRDFFTQSGHYAKDVAKSAAEKMVNDKLKQLKLQKEEASLREKLGVKSGAGKMPTIDAPRNMAILNAMSSIGEPVEPEMFTRIFGDVEIDIEKCSGCNMCVMFCPTDALRKGYDQPEDEDMQYLEFSMADCTQCNLCADACLKKCLEVIPMVDTAELFDFEPRLIEIPKAKKGNKLFNRNK